MTITHVGFTGSARALTDVQIDKLLQILFALNPEFLHHGDCVVGDEIAHKHAIGLGMHVYIHPASEDPSRAHCDKMVGVYDNTKITILPEKIGPDRNKDIVDDSTILIACPGTPEMAQSGTWDTIRYARSKHREIYIIYPQGIVIHEDIVIEVNGRIL